MKTLKEIRQEHIRTVLETHGWDIKKASSVLKISEARLRKEVHRLSQPMSKKDGSSKGSHDSNGKTG